MTSSMDRGGHTYVGIRASDVDARPRRLAGSSSSPTRVIPNVSDRSRSVSVTLGLCTCSSDDEEQVPDKETDIGLLGIIRVVYTVILSYQPTP